MEALISKKNINDFEFSDDVSIAYIKALKKLHSNSDICEDTERLLRSAGLYKDGKLRVFNYKRVGKKVDYVMSDDIRFLMMLFDNPEKMLWFKPRYKYHREALEVLLNKYGLRKVAYLIYVMLPLAETFKKDSREQVYIPDVNNPSLLLQKIKSFSNQYAQYNISNLYRRLVAKRRDELETKIMNHYESKK